MVKIMYELNPTRLTRIFKIVNLLSAKELSDLLSNLGVNERFPHHERITARDRVIEVLNDDFENLIGNLGNKQLIKILDIIQVPNTGNRYSNQKEVLSYFNSKSSELPSKEKLIGTYIDHDFIVSLLYEFHSLEHTLNKKDLEILHDAHEAILFLYESNPEDEYLIRMYSYIFGEYSGYTIRINPVYVSISMDVKDNPVVAAYSGTKPQELTTLLYYVDKDGIIKGKPTEIMSQAKLEVSKKTNL